MSCLGTMTILIENEVYVSLNGNGLYYLERTLVASSQKKMTWISSLGVKSSAKRGNCVDINLEENRIYILSSSLVTCAVTLQYIFFLILTLAGDIEQNPGPTGISHSFGEIINHGEFS